MDALKPAEQVLYDLIDALVENLEEISMQDKKSRFALGEVYAYAECLEVIQTWEKAKEYGLNFNLENKFKIS